MADHIEERLPGSSKPRPLLTERFIAADLDVDGRVATVAGFHAPFAAGSRVWDTTWNRLSKRAAYDHLTEWAAQAATQPLIVGMDSNTTSDWPRSAPQRLVRPRSPYRRLMHEAQLFDLESAFHRQDAAHGLSDSLRIGPMHDPHGSRAAAQRFGMPLAMTHRLKHEAPRMDRIYVASVGVRRAGVCHGELGPTDVLNLVKGTKICTLSDHALVWADVSFDGELRADPNVSAG